MDPHIRKEVSLDSKGVYGGSRANSCVNSRVGSRENLCEECIQNPLDLIDASIQVDLSDSENDWGSDEEGGGGGKGGAGPADDGTMGKRRGGELGVNKKGTPLYSREDIREQYCINDKELQVLDRQGSKGFFGCFSNQGQAGFSPCSGNNKNKKSLLGSCIARTSSEEELQNQIQTTAKRPISPGLRSTTWNGQHRYFDPRLDEEDGFDEHYFRRRPKSFCVPPGGPGGPGGPQGRYLPQGGPGMAPGGPQPLGIPTSGMYPDPRTQMSMASLVEADQQQQQRMMAYGSHPMLRTTPYPSVGHLPPAGPGGAVQPSNIPTSSMGYGGGYTLPPTAQYFPVGTYSTLQAPSGPQQTTIIEMQQQQQQQHQQHDSSTSAMTQPNTPDLLMHRRQAGTPEVSLDDRKQKHVSFDSSSLMRSQTLATMDEASFHRMQSAQMAQSAQPVQVPIMVSNTTPSKSYERLIDGKTTPDFEYFNQVLPPELARQIMMERLKRNSMRTQATQTDVNNVARNRHSSHIPISPKSAQKVFMVSEGVQTNGFNNGSSLPPNYSIPPPPLATATATSPIRTMPSMEYTSPAHLRSTATPPHLPGSYQLQVYHIDGREVTSLQQAQDFAAWSYGSTSNGRAPIYATSPRPPKDVTTTTYSGDARSGVPHRHKKTTRSMSQGDMLGPEEIQEALLAVQQSQQQQQQMQHHQQQHPQPHQQQRRQQQHPKSHDSPQRKRVPGGIVTHHGHHHHHHHHHKPHTTHRGLHKSHSDGELIDDEEVNGGKDRAHYRSCKAVKFVARQDAPQQTVVKGLAGPTSEEEASDRDMPELAPICLPSVTTSAVKKSTQPEDIEQDLGTKLSPLGSTSSLQDLIESNSAGEMVSESQNSFTWTTLERQKLAMAGETLLMPEETAAESQDSGKNNLSACEDNSEDAEEHVSSYLEQPPLKVLEKKFPDEDEEGNDNSRKSSSSGSYSVTSALAGQHIPRAEKGMTDIIVIEQLATPLVPETTPQTEEFVSSVEQEIVPEPSPKLAIEEVESERKKEISEEKPAEPEPEPKPTPAMIRKQELTLDLQREAAALPFKSPQDITSSFSPDDSASENSMMWQRLPMGTGDVQKKRQAFEQQIRCLSEDSKPKILNGKVKTPSSGGVRKIVSEERPTLGGAGGLARSPAMHSGFRTEDWVVERTPVNTPVNDRVLVGMINLSDEETSFRGSSEDLCKSSGATTPQGSINSSSFAPSTLDLTKTETTEKTAQESKAMPEEEELTTTTSLEPVQAQPETSLEMTSEIPESGVKVEEEDQHDEPDGAQVVVVVAQKVEEPIAKAVIVKEASKNGDQPVPLMAPPAGFGDSPEHVPHKKIPGFHEALADQVLPQEELLIAEDFAPPAVATLHIAESFQSVDSLSSGRKESYVSASAAEMATTVADYQVVEAAPVEPATTAAQSLERQTKRKLSSSSSASRTSGHSSHRSRSRSRSKERLLSKLAHSGDINITTDEDDDIGGLYLGAYDRTAWAFIGKLTTSSRSDASHPGQLIRSDSIESTQSEREFRKKYQAITHRMVHRKSSAVMYSRILERTFECNKTVRVRRVRGEFGFRIHGSRPVVVSAIEPNTPAETSGLEVGDIILTINGINVLDLPHTEVVKTAQAGSDELELGLARVPELTYPEDPIDVALGRFDDSQMTLHSGYLWKLSRSVLPDSGSGSVAKWSRRFFVLRADSCLYFFKQENESRPLGAILVSGCTILEGCEAEDQQTGVGRNFSFRLIFEVKQPPRPTCPHKTAELDTYYGSAPRILCLAADSKEELTPWLNVIDHCAQIQENSEDLWRVVAEQRQQICASHFPHPDCRGYLLKLDGISRTWKRRFCVLADACLFLYIDADSPSAYATLCLHGYRVQSTGSIGGTKRHAFELIPPEQGFKFFYFLAETETEKKRWLASLEYSMDRWMKLL